MTNLRVDVSRQSLISNGRDLLPRTIRVHLGLKAGASGLTWLCISEHEAKLRAEQSKAQPDAGLVTYCGKRSQVTEGR